MLTSYFHLWYLVKLRFSMVSVWILSYFYLHYMILLMSSMTNVTDLLCFFLRYKPSVAELFSSLLLFFSPLHQGSDFIIRMYWPHSRWQIWSTVTKRPLSQPSVPLTQRNTATSNQTTEPPQQPASRESQRKPPLSAPTRQPLISTFLVCKGPGILRFLSV